MFAIRRRSIDGGWWHYSVGADKWVTDVYTAFHTPQDARRVVRDRGLGRTAEVVADDPKSYGSPDGHTEQALGRNA